MTTSSLPLPPMAVSMPESDRPADPDAAFDRHAAALHRFLLVRTGGDGHLADDLMQQLWIQLHRGGRAVPPEELEFWLRRVARNLLSATWRSNGRAATTRIVADPALAAALADRLCREQLPAAMLEQREVREQLLLALTALSTSDQELMIEHYFNGRPLGRIAADMQVSERAIEGRLYRARRALRDRLAQLED